MPSTQKHIHDEPLADTPEDSDLYLVEQGYNGIRGSYARLSHGALTQKLAGVGLFATSGALYVQYGTTPATAAAGDDARITGAIQTGSTAGGDLAGRWPNPTVATLSGQPFAPSATIDATDAANISSGTLAPGRLPTPTTATLGGIQSTLGVSHQWLASISDSGVPALSRPASADLSDLGQPNAAASLDGTGKLPPGQVPTGLVGARQWRGAWNASTNSPALTSGAGTQGDQYEVTTAGSSALDGTSAWLAGDQLVYSGTAWQRFQKEFIVASLIFSSGDYLQSPAALPNFARIWRDAAGGVAGGIDGGGALWWTSANVQTLNLTVGFSYSGALPLELPSSIAVSGASTIQAPQGGAFPPFTKIVRDSSGNVSSMLDPITNTQHYQNLTIHGALSVSGVNSSGVPEDAADVTIYGATTVGAAENICGFITTSGTSIIFYNYHGTVTLTQNDNNSAILYLDGVGNRQNTYFQPSNSGDTVYVQFDGGYTLGPVTMVWQSAQYALLQGTGTITPQAAQVAKVSWPCLIAGNAGHLLQVEGMGQANWYAAPTQTTKNVDTVATYGTQPFLCTILNVTAPNAATVGTAFPFSWTAQPGTMRWGQNSADAVAQAAAKKQKLYFPGPGNYWCWSCVASNPGEQVYAADGLIADDFGEAFNGTIWLGSAKVLAWAQGGKLLPKRCAPVGSDPSLHTDFWFPPGATPRCAQLSSVNLMVTGDSQSFLDPQAQGTWTQAFSLWQAVEDANPSKTINFADDSIGATTLSDQADPANLQNGSTYATTGGLAGWLLPATPTGTHAWLAYTLNGNQSGSGPAWLPDLVVQGDNGGNDAQTQDIDSYFSWYNQVRAISHGDALGPTDVMWWSDIAVVMSTYQLGAGGAGGGGLPDPATHMWWTFAATGLHRQLARYLKSTCYDLAPGAARISYGYDPFHPLHRMAPQVSGASAPGAPFALPWPTQDLDLWLTPTGASDDAIWGSSGIGPRGLRIKTSPRYGGYLYLARGNNGNLWYAHAIDGCVATTTCTIGSGSTALTVGSPTALQDTFTIKSWPQLSSGGAQFSGGSADQVIMMPTNQHERMQRNFIAYDFDTSNVRLYNNVVDGGTHSNEAWGNTASACTISGSTLTVGGTIAGTWGGSHSTAPFTPTANDQSLTYAGAPDGLSINKQLTGTPGGAGTYQLNAPLPGTVGSPTAMTSMPCTVGGVHFYPADNFCTPDVVFYLPNGHIFATKVAYGGYTSPTQVTLRDPAPDAQLASGASIPVFIGQMAPGFADSGISLASMSSVSTLRISIRRGRLVLGLVNPDGVHVFTRVSTHIVRNYGVPFLPRLDTPGGTMSWTVSNVWITRDAHYTPQRSPWQVRGWRDAPFNSADGGGAGGHPGSDISRYVDGFLQTNAPVLH